MVVTGLDGTFSKQNQTFSPSQTFIIALFLDKKWINHWRWTSINHPSSSSLTCLRISFIPGSSERSSHTSSKSYWRQRLSYPHVSTKKQNRGWHVTKGNGARFQENQLYIIQHNRQSFALAKSDKVKTKFYWFIYLFDCFFRCRVAGKMPGPIPATIWQRKGFTSVNELPAHRKALFENLGVSALLKGTSAVRWSFPSPAKGFLDGIDVMHTSSLIIEVELYIHLCLNCAYKEFICV